MKTIFQTSLLALLVTTACAKAEKDDVSSEYAETNVDVTESTENGGTITGSFKKDASGDQVMVGNASSANKETFITMPPGALSIDTEISMADGANDNPNVLPSALEMADTAILGGSDPVVIDSSALAETVQPYTLAIPLPISQASTSQLFLADGTSKVAILYLVKTTAGNKIGLFVLGKDDLIGTIVRYKGAKFGWFRIVLLSNAVSSVEKTTQQEPTKKS